MTTVKTVALSSETISEIRMAFASRIARLNESLRDSVELDVPTSAIWSDRIVNAEVAEREFLSASDTPDQTATGKYADWYPLLRRMVLAQIKGDYEAGERFALILQEHGAPNNEAEFDKFMGLAAKAMGARA